jgi:hypothetical protein
MLLQQNIASVAYRYPQDAPSSLPGPIPTPVPMWYRFTRPRRSYSPVEILSALHCYEYQSCENPEWESSEAFQFCEALRDRMIRSLPGYDDAPWEITDNAPRHDATEGGRR